MSFQQTLIGFSARRRHFHMAVLRHGNFRQKIIFTALIILSGLLFGACSARTIRSNGSSACYPRAGTGSTAVSLAKPESSFSTHVIASWYGPGYEGRRTASGEVFDPDKFTAASNTLPLGSIVRVTNPRNRRSVDVRINDRGPAASRRSIDLSPAAAQQIGLTKDGVERVRVTIVRK